MLFGFVMIYPCFAPGMSGSLTDGVQCGPPSGRLAVRL